MQQFTNAALKMPAQHQQLDPWGFPVSTMSPPPTSGPVRGGGAAPLTVARIRWGRVLPLLAGAALLAFGMWAYSTQGDQRAAEPLTVTGGGLSIAQSTTSTDAPQVAPAVTPPVTTAAPTSAKSRASAAKARSARRAKAARRTKAQRRARAARRSALAQAATVASAGGVAQAATAPTVAGGGAGPASELPMTGLETWIAGGLGVLLLLIGIGVQINAVRIAATAMLYRRGILLRPVDCARLAQSSLVPRMRVTLSNVLHRLLEEPHADGGFAAARIAR